MLKLRLKIIISLSVLLLFGISSLASAATLYFSPDSGSYKIGQQFSVGVYVSSSKEAMNAASGVVSFPAGNLEVVSLSKSGSIFSLWVQEPTFSNSGGTINFEGIVLNPGFTGSGGKIMSINFKAKGTGSSALSFSSASVLANDGKGTNILTGVSGANFNIITSTEAPKEETPKTETLKTPQSPVVTSLTHPDQNKWYANSNPEFSWGLPSDVTAVSLVMTKKETGDPGSNSDGKIESKKFENVDDGIWYLHIKFKNSSGWGKTSHYKVMIDTQPPSAFEIRVDNQNDPTNPRPLLYFNSEDQLSGLDYYELKIGDKESFRVTENSLKATDYYQLPAQEPGKYPIVIKAVDKVSSATIASAQLEIKPLATPEILELPKSLNNEEVLTIKGTSQYPGATITVFVKKDGQETQKFETKADTNGDWVFTASQKLEKGNYEVWVQLTDNRGAKSNLSEKKNLEVSVPAFFKISSLAIGYATLLIILAILIAGALFIILYIKYKITMLRRKVKKETVEVQQTVVRAFKALREEVQEQVEMFDEKPKLTKKEKEIRDKLKDALNISEDYITKEIKDIFKELE